MKLNNKELYHLFSEKGVHHLYHANTVRTSRTFIKQGGLMSRGAVELNGLPQTGQETDEIDRLFNIWNDVFLDTVDLHNYFGRQNYYGPIVFKLSTDFLIETDFEIWVTKDNPKYWTEAMTTEQKYFQSVQELRDSWDAYQRQRKMTMIKNVVDAVLFDYVEEVIVDNPNVQNNQNGIIYFNQAVTNLKQTLLINPPLKSKFSTRTCNGCYCKSNYINQVSIADLNRLFL